MLSEKLSEQSYASREEFELRVLSVASATGTDSCMTPVHTLQRSRTMYSCSKRVELTISWYVVAC